MELQRIEVTDVDAVIEPEKVRPVLLDELDVAREPVAEETLQRRVAAIGHVVEIGPLRIEKVGLFLF